MEKKDVKKAAEKVEEKVEETIDAAQAVVEQQPKKKGWKKWLIIAGTVVLAAGAGLYLYKKGSGSDEVEEVEPACNESSCCGDCNRNDNNYNNKHYHKH